MKIVYSSKGKLFIHTWTRTLKISIICIASPHDLKLTLSLVEPLKTKTKSLAKLLEKKKKKEPGVNTSACHEIILTHSSLRVYFIHGKEKNTSNLGKIIWNIKLTRRA